MTRWGTVLSTLAAAAVLVVAAACSGATLVPRSAGDRLGNAPSSAASTPTSPTRTPSSRPSSPVANGRGAVGDSLDDVDAATRRDAEEFTLRFMRAYDRAWLSGKTDEFEAMYSDACDRCYSEAKYLAGVYSSGGRIQGGTYADPRPTVKGRDGDAITVVVQTEVAAYQVVDSSGLPTKSGSAEQTSESFLVTKTSGGWRVVRWEFRP